MIPEDMESLKKAQRSEKASMEKPVHVRGHPPETVYANSPTTISHQEKDSARAKEYKFGITYHEAEVEAEDEVGGDRNSSELNIANMAGESLGDNHHGIRRDSGEDGGSYYVP
nr:hypothetical protein Iba_chr02cCG3220 [Ipomoea batatas]